MGDDTLYLVGTTVGLFGTSSLKGENTVWEQIASDVIGSTIVEYITYRAVDGLLVIGTYGNGIYQTNITSIGNVLSTKEKEISEEDIFLFPNPVNDELNIQFNLKRQFFVKGSVYDALGRQVMKIKQNQGIIGNNKITLDLTRLENGIYFVTLNINNNTITKQIIKK